MFKKGIQVVGLTIVLALLLVSVAAADTVKGEGWLQADGSGYARLRLNGTVTIDGQGIGVVIVRGADIIEASGEGKRTDYPNGTVIFRGYEGQIKVSGERMEVRMVGGMISFYAEGKGIARLRGQGTYETGHTSGDWSEDEVKLGLGVEE